MEYKTASRDFEKFLRDALEPSGLATTNQVYTMTQGVFQAFRRRLEIDEAILFAGVLPPILRAIFVADWNTSEPKQAFEDRQAMTRDVQSLRRNHNLSPDTCLRDVTIALRKNIDEAAFERVLEMLPPGAADFWRV
jgi:uncharacterized protein (DUF2267 family)